jgi:hypothetical protein
LATLAAFPFVSFLASAEEGLIGVFWHARDGVGLTVLPLVDGAPPIGFWRYTCNEALAICVH